MAALLSNMRNVRYRKFARLRKPGSRALRFLSGVAEALDATGADLSVSAVANASDALTITGHGLATGAGPFVIAATTTLPAGTTAGELYWVVVVDEDTVKLALSRDAAFAGDVVNLTSDGSGTITLTPAETAESMLERLRDGAAPETLAAATDVDDL